MRVLKFILLHIRPYSFYILGMFLATCVISLEGILKPYMVKKLIDTVSGHTEESLWMICGFYCLLQFIIVLAWNLKDYCANYYNSRFRLDIMQHFIEHLYSYSYNFFQNQFAGSITAKINDVFQLLPGLIWTIISEFIYCILLIIIALKFLSNVHIMFAISLIIWIILFFLLIYIKMGNINKVSRDYTEEKSKIFGGISDYLNNIFSVKIFVTKDYELSRFSALKNNFIKIALKQGGDIRNFYFAQNILNSLYSASNIILLIYGYQNGILKAGDFAFIMMMNSNIISGLNQVGDYLRSFIPNWSSVDQILGLLETPPEVQDIPDAKVLKVNKGNIIFENVGFHYKGTSGLFKNLSVVIEGGQKVGLVGYSGSGKTSFVNLILRLYNVTKGHILIDGQDISRITQDSLRSNIALIPQDPSLFHRSILENIRCGLPSANDQEVIEAAKAAHAHDFIIKLPKAYDSLVGERGIKLSGGQRQRIAIARAILKEAAILILDEATSGLDSVTEKYIQESLKSLMQEKTTIVIAHRLSTLLNMDRILVFDKGEIIEDGTHSELLKKGGLYKKLWDAQIGGFLPEHSTI